MGHKIDTSKGVRSFLPENLKCLRCKTDLVEAKTIHAQPDEQLVALLNLIRKDK